MSSSCIEFFLNLAACWDSFLSIPITWNWKHLHFMWKQCMKNVRRNFLSNFVRSIMKFQAILLTISWKIYSLNKEWRLKRESFWCTLRAIISRGLYIFYTAFHCGLYRRAVSVTDNIHVCTKQENSSIIGSKIRGL